MDSSKSKTYYLTVCSFLDIFQEKGICRVKFSKMILGSLAQCPHSKYLVKIATDNVASVGEEFDGPQGAFRIDQYKT